MIGKTWVAYKEKNKSKKPIENSVASDLSTAFLSSQDWTDPRLSWNPADYEGTRHLTLSTKDIWMPNIGLRNRFEKQFQHCTPFDHSTTLRKISSGIQSIRALSETENKLTHIILALFGWTTSSFWAIREIKGFVTYICVIRWIRVVFLRRIKVTLSRNDYATVF